MTKKGGVRRKSLNENYVSGIARLGFPFREGSPSDALENKSNKFELLSAIRISLFSGSSFCVQFRGKVSLLIRPRSLLRKAPEWQLMSESINLG